MTIIQNNSITVDVKNRFLVWDFWMMEELSLMYKYQTKDFKVFAVITYVLADRVQHWY